jgi:hypothetical protein
MKLLLEMNAPRPLLLEWKEPRATALLEEMEGGIEVEARAFRAAIVARWAAEYAGARAADGGGGDAAALADLRRWSHAYFHAAGDDGPDETDDRDPDPDDDARLDVQAA